MIRRWLYLIIGHNVYNSPFSLGAIDGWRSARYKLLIYSEDISFRLALLKWRAPYLHVRALGRTT